MGKQRKQRKQRKVVNQIKKFCSFVKKLPVANAKDLQFIVDSIYEPAVDIAWFTKTAALICKKLANITVSANNTENPLKTFNFGELLINRCQKEFEKNSENYKQFYKKIEDAAEACTNLDRKKEVLLLITKRERIFQITALGNIRFTGELFKQSMLSPKIMIRFLLDFLKNKDDDRLECLCELLKIVGKKLESTLNISCFFVEIQEILDTEAEKFSSDTRDMLRDVIRLRNSKWVQKPRFFSSLKNKETDVEQSNMRKIKSELNGDNIGCDNKKIRKESDSQQLNIDKIKSNPNGENVDRESQRSINAEILKEAETEQLHIFKIKSEPSGENVDHESQRIIYEAIVKEADAEQLNIVKIKLEPNGEKVGLERQRINNEAIVKEADAEQLNIVKIKSEPNEENVARESQRIINEAIAKEADAEQLNIVKIKSEPDEENVARESQRIINEAIAKEADAEQLNIVKIKSEPDEENVDPESQRIINDEIVKETDAVVVVFILILFVYCICGFFTC